MPENDIDEQVVEQPDSAAAAADDEIEIVDADESSAPDIPEEQKKQFVGEEPIPMGDQKGVQKRIGSLAAKWYQERNRAEQLERIARVQMEELEQYRRSVPELAKGAVESKVQHLQSQVGMLALEYAEAMAAGDPKRTAEAFQKMNQAQVQVEMLKNQPIPEAPKPQDHLMNLHANGHLATSPQQFVQDGQRFLQHIGAYDNPRDMEVVQKIASQVDQDFVRSGQKIGSYPYFQQIEESFRKAKLGQGQPETTRQAAAPQQQAVANAAPTVVASATRGPSGASAKTNKVVLTAEERELCARNGIDVKRYAQAKRQQELANQ